MVVIVALLAGCGASPELRRQASSNEARAAAFVELMDRGETSREQEQSFIRACARAFRAFRESLELPEPEEVPHG